MEYSSAYYLLASSVTDGTPCGVDTYDMCVGGVCVAAGCDHVLGSSARLGKLSSNKTLTRSHRFEYLLNKFNRLN